jgi:hypothetical protein
VTKAFWRRFPLSVTESPAANQYQPTRGTSNAAMSENSEAVAASR